MKTPANDAPCRGRPRCFDPEVALDKAMRVFWEKGYLGTSLLDLTEAMGINRPSLYSAFGNKEALYRKVLERYAQGPTACLHGSVNQPSARAVASHRLHGIVELLTAPDNPGTCLWVHGVLSCGGINDPLASDLALHRVTVRTELLKRFERARAENDLPPEADPAALADFLQTVTCGLAVLAFTGASREDLLRVVETTLRAWPAARTE
ncbi:MAG: TetR/AcrR family transcriptional regulator [Verrucomicrobiota bacterium]